MDELNERLDRLVVKAGDLRESHDALLAALKAIVKLDDGDNTTLWPHEKLFMRARVAIAKAENL